IDYYVEGEGEVTFSKLLEELYQGNKMPLLPGLYYPGMSISDFRSYIPDFLLSEYPSPYLNSVLPVQASIPVYLETVRGCKSSCTYCFYPKSSSRLRSLELSEIQVLLQKLKDSGAKELVFLDPTFNHRQSFEDLLDMMSSLNLKGQCNMFAELRAEGLNQKLARKLSEAGFTKIEIGLQSINTETLKKIQRYGNPKKVAEVARLLEEEGMDLLLDLIVGLPGDTPEDVLSGVDFFIEEGLTDYLQIFPLSVLPGTVMRGEAEKEGLKFLDTPPYYIQKTKSFTYKQIQETLEEVEYRLDYRIDEYPRPHLVDFEYGQSDVYKINYNEYSENMMQLLIGPASSHHAIWFTGKDLFSQKESIIKALRIRKEIDPFCILDVVLNPEENFPLDLLDYIKKELETYPSTYIKRQLAFREEDMQHRLIILLPLHHTCSLDWVLVCMNEVRVYKDTWVWDTLRFLPELGMSLPAARILDPKIDSDTFERLKEEADPEAISFASRLLEKRWTAEVLGYERQ
ncbi:MAG: radical SAM protein, partial [Leptospiraceae bacterium]|nr:radical SAM protein [Leptospiraceae bacterium]